ncbi:GNAT family N-acetyltransferase [Bacillus sp. H-16]|uniref:GNAT family N-acetyltransferase n=1 Tax=Alteribacter salitolerans TaxID=2912333 RepID=UPI0019644C77|nr:GNAT family N-acetyltransferase [Alteribacter salitolerans]MBM7096238.1 GNAT family N-acetyltransferase [Alteribacter salitolerans]
MIKSYSSEYQDEVVELILSIQQTEYSIPITKDDQPDLLKIEDVYQNGAGNFWVAVHNGKVAGTISLLDIGEGHVALRKMFVHKDYRGKPMNTASLLLKTAQTWARSKYVSTIYLGTTPQFLAAHRFYEKNGFTEIEQTDLPERFPVLEVDKKFYKYDIR